MNLESEVLEYLLTFNKLEISIKTLIREGAKCAF